MKKLLSVAFLLPIMAQQETILPESMPMGHLIPALTQVRVQVGPLVQPHYKMMEKLLSVALSLLIMASQETILPVLIPMEPLTPALTPVQEQAIPSRQPSFKAMEKLLYVAVLLPIMALQDTVLLVSMPMERWIQNLTPVQAQTLLSMQPPCKAMEKL